jgi:hypothetical protein
MITCIQYTGNVKKELLYAQHKRANYSDIYNYNINSMPHNIILHALLCLMCQDKTRKRQGETKWENGNLAIW